jgi:hypothetical protein
VKEAGGVDQVEGVWAEGHREDVVGEQTHGGRKLRLAQGGLTLVHAFCIQVYGNQGSTLADPLAEALDPERRRTPGVEHLETPDISEQVELAVAEGDEVFFELFPLFGYQGVLPV